MYKIRTYACEGVGAPIGEQFRPVVATPHRFDIMLADGEMPRFCPVCGCEVDSDAEPIPGTHAIGGSAIARSTDGMYRELEQSSAARAEEVGDPRLKITDLKDNLREGDVAAKAPDNAVTRFAREARAALGTNYMGWGGGFATPGQRVGPMMPTGTPGQAYAGPGHVALAAAQPEHEARVRHNLAHPSAAPYKGGR